MTAYALAFVIACMAYLMLTSDDRRRVITETVICFAVSMVSFWAGLGL